MFQLAQGSGWGLYGNQNNGPGRSRVMRLRDVTVASTDNSYLLINAAHPSDTATDLNGETFTTQFTNVSQVTRDGRAGAYVEWPFADNTGLTIGEFFRDNLGGGVRYLFTVTGGIFRNQIDRETHWSCYPQVDMS